VDFSILSSGLVKDLPHETDIRVPETVGTEGIEWKRRRTFTTFAEGGPRFQVQAMGTERKGPT